MGMTVSLILEDGFRKKVVMWRCLERCKVAHGVGSTNAFGDWEGNVNESGAQVWEK